MEIKRKQTSYTGSFFFLSKQDPEEDYDISLAYWIGFPIITKLQINIKNTNYTTVPRD